MKKTVRWLTNEEANFLGMKLNKIPKQRHKARYYLNKNQWKTILENRNTGINDVAKVSNVEKENIPYYWDKTKRYSTIVHNPLYVKKDEKEKQERFKAFLEGLKDEVDSVAPIKRESAGNHNLCNQYTLTDYHLGMMSWAEETGDDWDLKIAEETLTKFFMVAIENSPKADECIFAQIGDFLHWDGLDAVTPMSKHVLDADTRFTKLVRVAIRIIRRIITMLLKKYKVVRVIMAEGNHDTASSVWMREMLSAFYENEPRLIVDTNPDPYYCVVFGDNALFYHHGHKRKINGLDSVFVGKFKKEFGGSKFAYGHLGHFHHTHKIESNLMILEQHRTLASKDAYASRGGYLSGRDAKVITYHKKYGEVARQTINIEMLK